MKCDGDWSFASDPGGGLQSVPSRVIGGGLRDYSVPQIPGMSFSQNPKYVIARAVQSCP